MYTWIIIGVIVAVYSAIHLISSWAVRKIWKRVEHISKLRASAVEENLILFRSEHGEDSRFGKASLCLELANELVKDIDVNKRRMSMGRKMLGLYQCIQRCQLLRRGMRELGIKHHQVPGMTHDDVIWMLRYEGY